MSTSSETVKTMATMIDLPNELIDQVGAEFDEDDWLALRLTCQKFNERFREYHLDSKYECRRIFLIRPSVDNLVKIAKHPSGVNLRVRRLDVVPTSPYQQECLLDLLRRLRLDPDGNNHVAKSPESKHQGSFEEHSSSDTEAIRHEIQKFANKDADEFSPTVANISALRLPLMEAFSSLPNIQCIRFHNGYFMNERAEINLFYPTLKFGPGTRIPRRCEPIEIDPYGYHSMGWDTVMSAASAIPRPALEKIIGHHPFPISCQWFEDLQPSYGNFQSSFPNLLILEFTVDIPLEMKEAWKKNFSCWLGSIGTKLETLKINGICFVRPRDLIPCPETHILSNLRRISLSEVSFDIGNLKAFLSHCKGKLVELVFTHCKMRDIKSDWFEMLKFLRDNFKLKLFTLELGSCGIGREMGEVEYVLPSLEVLGRWQSDSSVCKVTCKFLDCQTEKHIWRELDTHDSPDEFWNSISGGSWTDREFLDELDVDEGALSDVDSEDSYELTANNFFFADDDEPYDLYDYNPYSLGYDVWDDSEDSPPYMRT
ncbi:hypothetical protein TWF281_002908 [Arthrobotrys megalospora]